MKGRDWCDRCHAEVRGRCVSVCVVDMSLKKKCPSGWCRVIETEIFCLTPSQTTHSQAKTYTTFIRPSGM